MSRSTEHPLHLLVPANIGAPAASILFVRNGQTSAVLSILRSIAREPRVGSYSIGGIQFGPQGGSVPA